jgi:hypothetical protein
MRRWHEEVGLMRRRWRMELGNHVGGFMGPEEMANHCWLAPPSEAVGIKCHCARGIGTMRKQRPYDGWGQWNKYEKIFQNRKRSNQKRVAIEFEFAMKGEE